MTKTAAPKDALKRYKEKRNFDITPEPSAEGQRSTGHLRFVIQKHWATRLHYDFRLELDGAMKSWAVPKGPSFDPADKRMAMHVEDHPISYNDFEGEIPAKQYGAGKVIIWDKGVWMPLGPDPAGDYRRGRMKFELHGHKLRGAWALVRMRGKDDKRDPWLLIKEKDNHAQPAEAFSVVDEHPDSVAALPPPEVSQAPAGAAPVQSDLPPTLAPQLATLVERPPSDHAGWAYELKYDGYRMLARIEGKTIKLFTRNGNDWTAQLQALAQTLKQMKLPDGWYDGEVIAPSPEGLPDFQLLQQAFDGRDTSHLVYYLFDLPYCGGYDLRQRPLAERRQLLASLLENAPPSVRFSDSFDVDATDILASACQMGLEGMIGKRQDSTYSSRRSQDWIKLKCAQRQEFVIVGYTEPAGARQGFGSLLLAVHDAKGKLKYAGNVGTGFDDQRLRQLLRKMRALHATSPTVQGSGIAARKVHWIRPELVAEVSFANWTRDGHIRHSVFRGLRTDKPASVIAREEPVTLGAHDAEETAPAAGSPLAGLRITHPERVIDDASGATKIQVLRYYALVAPLIMPHLKDRPVSLVRAPSGVAGELFFQKHLERAKLVGVNSMAHSFDPDHPPYMIVAQPVGLLNAAQMNVLEFHTWNTTRASAIKPDRFILDLDPGQGVHWDEIKQATLLVRSFIEELGLQCLLKTSGGKGLHLVVPIRRQYSFEVVKAFSQAIVQHMASVLPQRFSAKSGGRNRVGKIFVDYLRNGFGATTACAWSLRARPGLGISTPVAWDELDRLHSAAQWHLGNIHERLDVGNKPWDDCGFERQSLGPAMRALDFKPAAGAER
ncbi:DNA ligase D [Herbaspirillum sp. YR522]|uniref:DNA ligase D n=1 Tax=Herbaspirillum sp. YR522 TaxID=1144342 RepID=UPI00026FA2F4|nr:DNA ligase D [Herbaspirillum sp. YR522]EJM98290.1 DNA ligase D [Herbaspirillum sp. YR522]